MSGVSFQNLSNEVKYYIFLHALSNNDVLTLNNIGLVCKSWKELQNCFNNHEIWSKFYKSKCLQFSLKPKATSEIVKASTIKDEVFGLRRQLCSEFKKLLVEINAALPGVLTFEISDEKCEYFFNNLHSASPDENLIQNAFGLVKKLIESKDPSKIKIAIKLLRFLNIKASNYPSEVAKELFPDVFTTRSDQMGPFLLSWMLKQHFNLKNYLNDEASPDHSYMHKIAFFLTPWIKAVSLDDAVKCGFDVKVAFRCKGTDKTILADIFHYLVHYVPGVIVTPPRIDISNIIDQSLLDNLNVEESFLSDAASSAERVCQNFRQLLILSEATPAELNQTVNGQTLNQIALSLGLTEIEKILREFQ
jgi:hypothetical protein